MTITGHEPPSTSTTPVPTSRGRDGSAVREGGTYLGLVLLGVAVFLMLTGLNAFYAGVVAAATTWAIAANGLNVISGFGGYPSLVQGAFYGLGAYVSTIFLGKGLNFWLTGLLGIAAALVGGLAVGVFFSRTRGQYFAIGTLFCGAVFTLVLDNWTSQSGGPNGLPVPLGVGDIRTIEALMALGLSGSLALTHIVGRRTLGHRLRAIRSDEDLAEHIGVPTTMVKLSAFVLSAGVGGAAGVLLAQYNGSVSPDLFTYYVGFLMFVTVGIGGSGRLLGPLLGSIFVVGLPQLLKVDSGWSQLVVGIAFVVVTILFPTGFIGLLDAAVRPLRRLSTSARQRS